MSSDRYKETNVGTITLIAGDTDSGPIIYDPAKQNVLYRSDDGPSGVWSTPTAQMPSGFTPAALCGENSHGVAACDTHNQVQFLDDYAKGVWTSLPTPPIAVAGIAGDNKNGVIVFGGKSAAYLLEYSNPKWLSLPDAPFPVTGMTGDNRNGVAIFGGIDNSQVAYLADYGNPQWVLLATPLFAISYITGDNRGGIIALDQTGNRLMNMTNYTTNAWQELLKPGFQLTAISGNNPDGLVALGSKSIVVQCQNFAQNSWSILRG